MKRWFLSSLKNYRRKKPGSSNGYVSFKGPTTYRAFIGRAALMAQRARPLKRRLVILTMNDPDCLLFGEEPIYRNGSFIGHVTSGAYGHTLGRSVGLGYLEHPDGITPAFLASGTYEIEVASERFGVTPHLRAPFDPAGTRIRA